MAGRITIIAGPQDVRVTGATVGGATVPLYMDAALTAPLGYPVRIGGGGTRCAYVTDGTITPTVVLASSGATLYSSAVACGAGRPVTLGPLTSGDVSAARPTISGSRGGNAALASLLTGLDGLGLVVDDTTAS